MIIVTTAHVPNVLARDWLQHLRDFDTAHPGCHFEVAAQAPSRSLDEVVDAMRLNPALPLVQVFNSNRA